jgi:hypothetical protein
MTPVLSRHRNILTDTEFQCYKHKFKVRHNKFAVTHSVRQRSTRQTWQFSVKHSTLTVMLV